MKTTWLVFLIVCWASAEAQVPTSRAPGILANNTPFVATGSMVLRDFPVEPQWYPSSCWAATLSMTAKYIARDSTHMNQCYFVDKLENGGKCGCRSYLLSSGNSIINLAAGTCNLPYNSSRTDTFSDRYRLAKTISDSAVKLNKKLNFQFLRTTIAKGNPIIHAYKYQSGETNPGYHVYLLSGTENPKWTDSVKSLNSQFVLVKDPWPAKEGSEYYITYEQFYLHNGQENIVFSDTTSGTFTSGESEIYINKVFAENDTLESAEVAQKFLNDMQKIIKENPTSASSAFYEKSGLSRHVESLTVLTNAIEIAEITVRNNNGTSVVPHDTLTSFGYRDILYFIVNGNIPRSIIILSKSKNRDVANSHSPTSGWFVSRLESARKYQSVYDKVRTLQGRPLLIIRYTGAESKEILVKKISSTKFEQIADVSIFKGNGKSKFEFESKSN